MRIPVFVSCPTTLNRAQDASRRMILQQLERLDLEPRALGRSDYPTASPLREVLVLAAHCAGGVILGFEQALAADVTIKRGTKAEKKATSPIPWPTPWNQLESGILFGLRLPLLVFAEPGIAGGIFDAGVTDVFIHKIPMPGMTSEERHGLGAVFLKWQAEVRALYYR
jgi:hypothetical protein